MRKKYKIALTALSATVIVALIALSAYVLVREHNTGDYLTELALKDGEQKKQESTSTYVPDIAIPSIKEPAVSADRDEHVQILDVQAMTKNSDAEVINSTVEYVTKGEKHNED